MLITGSHTRSFWKEEVAVVHAMKACIEEHVLEDFFRTRGDEVRKVMQFDMRWERREQLIREEESNKVSGWVCHRRHA